MKIDAFLRRLEMYHDLMIQSILYFYSISVGEEINLDFVVAGGCIVWFSMHIAHFTQTHLPHSHMHYWKSRYKNDHSNELLKFYDQHTVLKYFHFPNKTRKDNKQSTIARSLHMFLRCTHNWCFIVDSAFFVYKFFLLWMFFLFVDFFVLFSFLCIAIRSI